MVLWVKVVPFNLAVSESDSIMTVFRGYESRRFVPRPLLPFLQGNLSLCTAYSRCILDPAGYSPSRAQPVSSHLGALEGREQDGKPPKGSLLL